MVNSIKISEIETSEISVVIQGAINNELTPKSIASVRKYLPGAEIILSTWEGSEVTGLDYDVLVLNKDPGATPLNLVDPLLNNCNRQLVSIQGGLKLVERKYTLKLRSDYHLEGYDFLKYWNTFQVRNEQYSIFEHRMIVSSVFTYEYSGSNKTPNLFHIGDFWYFGLTEDLKSYFMHTAVMPEEDMYNPNRVYLYPNKMPRIDRYWKYSPEQYYCVSWLKGAFSEDIKYEDITDFNPVNFEQYKNVLYNNFIVLGVKESGIHSKKYDHIMYLEDGFDSGIVSFAVFQKRYQEYCDASFQYIENSKSYDYKQRIKKHYNNFIMPLSAFFKWILEPFSCIYYLLSFIIRLLIKDRKNEGRKSVK